MNIDEIRLVEKEMRKIITIFLLIMYHIKKENT